MLRLEARAKINWSLDILGKRGDGYHEMNMLMSSVTLSDELTIEEAETGALTLCVSGNVSVSDTDNLILRAAEALRGATGCARGAALTLVKRTPVGAGMGGGSADAAAALTGLNRLWETGLSATELARLGLSVGADVPFALVGSCARVGGVGERIRPIVPAPVFPLVVVQPCKALSTREVFDAYDALPAVRHPDTDAAEAALTNRDLACLAQSAGNVLAQASEALRPQIAEAAAALTACGADYAAMTGSGSAVFGAFASEKVAQAAWRTLRKRWRKCWLTGTCESGIAFLP